MSAVEDPLFLCSDISLTLLAIGSSFADRPKLQITIFHAMLKYTWVGPSALVNIEVLLLLAEAT
jgi:hypothetical protein